MTITRTYSRSDEVKAKRNALNRGQACGATANLTAFQPALPDQLQVGSYASQYSYTESDGKEGGGSECECKKHFEKIEDEAGLQCQSGAEKVSYDTKVHFEEAKGARHKRQLETPEHIAEKRKAPASTATTSFSSPLSLSSRPVEPPDSLLRDEIDKPFDNKVDIVSVAELGPVFRVNPFNFTGHLGELDIGN
ncbi:hypothetical protein BGZ54_002378 [Gamsiella multidivaricata]|nr:hypothetical protein BGZ54_002378 [Gamsiella multidivaricata]